MPKDHTIKIKLEGGEHAMPDTLPLPDWFVGDTVRYSSSDPKHNLKIVFDNWPFAGQKHDIVASERLTVENVCTFAFRCFLETSPGVWKGWNEKNSKQSGADGKVGKGLSGGGRGGG